VYRCQGRPAAAAQCFQAAIQLSPTFAAAYAALGSALLDAQPYGTSGGESSGTAGGGGSGESVFGGGGGGLCAVANPAAAAAACCARALSLDPDNLSALATLLLAQQQTCSWAEGQVRQRGRLAAATAAELGLGVPLPASPDALPQGSGHASSSSSKPAGSATAAARAKKAQTLASGTRADGTNGVALAYSLPTARVALSAPSPLCSCHLPRRNHAIYFSLSIHHSFTPFAPT
jgi:tetratricopeptide (TPR) repeat protein